MIEMDAIDELLEKQIKELPKLETIIGHKFYDKNLVRTACTHLNFTEYKGINMEHSYEKLELLGDAVLDFIIRDYLYRKYPNSPSSIFKKLVTMVACNKSLIERSKKLGIERFLIIPEKMFMDWLKIDGKPLADMLEAIVGALYVDSGMENTKKVVLRLLKEDLKNSEDKVFSNIIPIQISKEYLNYKISGIEKVEEIINYRFKDKSSIEKVIASVNKVGNESFYKTLDFRREAYLGSAVYKVILLEFACNEVSEENIIGNIERRAFRTGKLSECETVIKLQDLLLSEYDFENMDAKEKSSSDLFKAVVGAVYNDTGFDGAKSFILSSLKDKLQRVKNDNYFDYKTELHNLIHGDNGYALKFEVTEEILSDGKLEFKAEVQLPAHGVVKGFGKSKKEAEKDASKAAWRLMEESRDNG